MIGESSNIQIEKQYRSSGLYEAILTDLRSKGISQPSRKDLSAYDEFHVRGASVSIELAMAAGLDRNMRVLDLGCGLGGPARMIADEYNCLVTGIDINSEFIRTARLLSKELGLENQTEFIQADALHLPFANESFEVVWTEHVQMNIKDKQKFYGEIQRVLTPGGIFIYYDVFKKNNHPPDFPLPWATNESISFLFSITEFNLLLKKLLFKKKVSADQTLPGIGFFKNTLKKMRADTLFKPGLHLILGDQIGLKFENLLKAMEKNRIVLESGMYKKP